MTDFESNNNSETEITPDQIPTEAGVAEVIVVEDDEPTENV